MEKHERICFEDFLHILYDYWFGFTCPRIGTEPGISLHNYEHSDSIERGEFHRQLNDCLLITKRSAVLS